jgi:hypothetical protein
LREGRTWDASFMCPAGTFLSSMNPFKWYEKTILIHSGGGCAFVPD